jgi:dihydroflavonol-4-reductase
VAEGKVLALVTGASGFVGGHLVEELASSGASVRCLVRSGSDRQWLAAGVDIAVGSMDDEQSLARAVDGADVVYHLAAQTSAVRDSDYDRVNYGGVVKLLAAMAKHARRSRLVFCSSLAVGGPARAGRPLTEADPPAPIGPYGVSKARAEVAVAASGVESVIVRPPAVYGPRDRDVLTVFRLAARGLVLRTGPRGQQLALIHVRDLVRGLIAAGRTREASGVFYVNGANHGWEAITAAIAAAVGRRPHVIGLPGAAVMAAGVVVRQWARWSGTRPSITPERALDLAQPSWTCDDSRARAELGYSPTVQMEIGIRETADWYRSAGWL